MNPSTNNAINKTILGRTLSRKHKFTPRTISVRVEGYKSIQAKFACDLYTQLSCHFDDENTIMIDENNQIIFNNIAIYYNNILLPRNDTPLTYWCKRHKYITVTFHQYKDVLPDWNIIKKLGTIDSTNMEIQNDEYKAIHSKIQRIKNKLVGAEDPGPSMNIFEALPFLFSTNPKDREFFANDQVDLFRTIEAFWIFNIQIRQVRSRAETLRAIISLVHGISGSSFTSVLIRATSLLQELFSSIEPDVDYIRYFDNIDIFDSHEEAVAAYMNFRDIRNIDDHNKDRRLPNFQQNRVHLRAYKDDPNRVPEQCTAPVENPDKEWHHASPFTSAPIQADDKSYNPFSKLSYLIKSFKQYKDHPIIVKLQKLLHFLLSFAVFDKLGLSINFTTLNFTKASEEAIKRTHSDAVDFFTHCIETFSYVFERLYDVYLTGSWNPIIRSGKAYGAWVDMVYSIKEDKEKLHNPEASGVNYHEFLERIQKCIEEGETIVRYATDFDDSKEKMMIKKLLADVRIIQANELTKRAAQKTRRAPLGILLYGGSSVGKSGISNYIFNHLGSVLDLPVSDDYKYTRCFSDEYWSGFTTSKWYIQLDDIAARNKTLADDTTISEILQIINNVPYTPPQADLADKGRTPLKPEVVVGTTNVQDLNAHVYYENTLAILRRFDIHVKVVPKPEFSKDSSLNDDLRMLDPNKCAILGTEQYLNCWDFHIYKVNAELYNKKQVARLVRTQIFTDTNDFLAFVSQRAIDHRTLQYKSLNASKSAMREVCKYCYRVKSSCLCIPCAECNNLVKECVCQSTSYFGDSESTNITSSEIQAGETYVLTFLLGVLFLPIFQVVQTRLFQWTYKLYLNFFYRTMIMKYREIRNHYFPVEDVIENIRESVKIERDPLKRLRLEKSRIRTLLVAYGDKSRSFISKHKIALSIITVGIPTMIIAYKFLTKRKEEVQGISQSLGGRIDAQDEKPNPWFRDEYIPTEFDTGRLTASWKPHEFDHVVSRVAKNVVHITCEKSDLTSKTVRRGKALCLAGQLYVTNYHNVFDKCTMKVTNEKVAQGITCNFEFQFNIKSAHVREDLDLVFFMIKCTPPKKDITELLPSNKHSSQCNGKFIQKTSDGVVKAKSLKAITKVENLYVSGLKKYIDSWKYFLDSDTILGDCGSIILGNTPFGPMILGLHQTGGLECKGTCIALTKSLYKEAVASLKEHIILPNAPLLETAEGDKLELQTIHHKSVFRYLEQGNAHVYGSLPGFRPKHSSKVADTFISPQVKMRGYHTNKGKPVMTGWQPWRKNAIEMVEQHYKFDSIMLQKCIEGYANDILSQLSPGDLKECIILDRDCAINGQPGVKFIDKMKRNTSMGFPWRSKKTNYLIYEGQHDIWQDYVRFDEDFNKRVDNIIDLYMKGFRYSPIMTGQLKDEPISLKKILSGATRVFSSCPADWAVVVRMYLLPFIRVMQNNKFIFEAAPGTNATSLEWEQIYRHLTKFGTDRMIAGDYSAYDKNMSAHLILAAYDVIKIVLKAAGWSDENLQIISGIAYDTAFPMTDFNGDLVEFWGSNPSGHPLTVIVNCIVNSLILRYVWMVKGNAIEDFQKYVALMTYGDDNILGVSPEISNYNHTVLVEEFAKLGIKYTMADKDAESVPFLDIKDTSFLKRTWVYESELKSHVARIEHASIDKMLLKYVPSKVLCPEAHSIEVINCALREYFFYGRQTFEEKRKMFYEIMKEAQILEFLQYELPTWVELIEAYKENSKDNILYSEIFEC